MDQKLDEIMEAHYEEAGISRECMNLGRKSRSL